jgi:hypothetical protein
MKRVLLALALLGLAVGNASADPSDLTGGVFIAHYEEAVTFTVDPTDWCAEIVPYLFTDPTLQVNQIDVETYAGKVWYVIAAWYDEDKEWCGTEFGFEQYDGGLFAFSEATPCYPGSGLEIPTAGWPGPGEGIAFVITDLPWMGNYIPVMAMAGYAYGYGASTVMQLGPNPDTGFGGFGNCANPPELFDPHCFGGMGINTPGTYCEPPPPTIPEGACCRDEECVVLTEEECIGQGGEYLGDNTDCGPPNPCQTPRTCCVGEECFILTLDECTALGGEQLPDYDFCDPNPCPFDVPQACCLENDECIIVFSEYECFMQNGYFPDPPSDTCDPNPCIVPIDETSWGEIKGMYR